MKGKEDKNKEMHKKEEIEEYDKTRKNMVAKNEEANEGNTKNSER
jgi:hypothetical protein